MRIYVGALATLLVFCKTEAFITPTLPTSTLASTSLNRVTPTCLDAKKNRRKRKTPPPTSTTTDPSDLKSIPEATDDEVAVEKMESDAPISISTDNTVVGGSSGGSTPFKFDRDEAIALGITDAEDDDDIIPEFASPAGRKKGAPLPDYSDLLNKGAVELPDIKQSVQKKKMRDQEPDEEEEKEEQKISRGDIASFKKLLEVEPTADEDDSFFQKEEYGTVSALLAEGAKPFLGIPSGPLQAGHFIGALTIGLMAFVEYPGFPLTNLPSPIRGALQGGLGTIYAINLVLAVFAVFKAGERGQSPVLWGIKTFSVGGLAFDQLTQLPTTEEVNKRLAKKGKRALKRNK